MAQHFLPFKASGCETPKLKWSDPGSRLWNDIDIKRALYFTSLQSPPMTHSARAIPAKEMSLFTKRRRAYVACTGCRKRKIKVRISSILLHFRCLSSPTVTAVCNPLRRRLQHLHALFLKGTQMRILRRAGRLFVLDLPTWHASPRNSGSLSRAELLQG